VHGNRIGFCSGGFALFAMGEITLAFILVHPQNAFKLFSSERECMLFVAAARTEVPM
jgi:hypothetical protein